MKSFLTGLVTGLTVGYLTAPRSGKATRNHLTEAANEQTASFKSRWNNLAAQINKLIDDLRHQSGLFYSESNLFTDTEDGKLDKYRREIQSAKETVKNRINNTVDDTTDAAKAGVSKVEQALKL